MKKSENRTMRETSDRKLRAVNPKSFFWDLFPLKKLPVHGKCFRGTQENKNVLLSRFHNTRSDQTVTVLFPSSPSRPVSKTSFTTAFYAPTRSLQHKISVERAAQPRHTYRYSGATPSPYLLFNSIAPPKIRSNN